MARFIEWWRRGSAMVWTSGAVLALSLLMIGGLVGYIAMKGLGFFWPHPIAQIQTPEGPALGIITNRETGPEGLKLQLNQGNRDLFGQDFRWIPAANVAAPTFPQDVVQIERMEYGPFMGRVLELKKDGEAIVSPNAANEVLRVLPEAKALRLRIRRIEKDEVGTLNREMDELRIKRHGLEVKAAPAEALAKLDAQQAALQERYDALQGRLDQLRKQAESMTVVLGAVDGQTKELPLASIIRIVPNNALGLFGKSRVYTSRLWEFIADDPRESNTEGGIFPAIFGTVMMVLLMSLMVVPLGVVAALFMREYAHQGWLIQILRVAVNNLAGVPSIVFGVFGLGFFVYTVGGTLDQLFFSDKLPTPTYGTGGILWASLTLALLTVPVVIVATEEALASVPRSQREASLALGSTKWQTIWNVVLPASTPGILTGLILAMARGAGEVAPLMLTGVVKLAPSMPLDGSFPYFHLDRKFMHLGFHIYDVGFQSPNSEAAKPMVFMTALLLLIIVLILNIFALRLRSRLRARMGGSTF